MKFSYKHIQGGNVPGGHNVIYNEGKKPFITPMKECNSIELKHSDIVVDIGAYVGTYALRCARFPVAEVRAFEPTKSTYDLLTKVKLPNYKPFNMCVVGDDSKSVKLYVSKGIGVTNSIVLKKRKAGYIEVEAINYKEAVKDATIVKIDVEGAEYSYQEIVQPSIRALIIDFHPVPGDWIAKAEKIISEIESKGFIPVIKPNWENGWTRAGSWIREVPEINRSCEVLMNGKACCGCGKAINESRKAICKNCSEVWTSKHKKNFKIANE